MSNFEARVEGLLREGSFFSADSEVYVCRAPGRLDLMGGNVDYTGGMVFQSTIREATWAAAQRRKDQKIVLWNPQMKDEGWDDHLAFDLAEFVDEEAVRQIANRDARVRWTAYVLGVFLYLQDHYPDKAASGASVYIESNVPLNKGVSSSAAVEVAVMKAAAACYGISLAGIELAEACQWTENVIAESACGIMDQAASVLGDEDHVLPILCQPCVPMPLVKLPENLRCWAIDSGVRHAVTGIEYEAARAAAFVGYGMICRWEGLPVLRDESGRISRYSDPRWHGFLSNLVPSEFRSRYHDRLPELISGAELIADGVEHPDPFTSIRPEVNYRVRACTRYAVEENHRIELFIELVRGNTDGKSAMSFAQMGELMYQSHWSYTECGLGCSATDELVDLVRRFAGRELFGAKITGGGAGGTVAVLGSTGGANAFQRLVNEYAKLSGRHPYVFEGSSPGADRFGVRVLRVEA